MMEIFGWIIVFFSAYLVIAIAAILYFFVFEMMIRFIAARGTDQQVAPM